jgi:peptide chain release factor 3
VERLRRYDAARINLMDTPGHADFSEDTYRTLSAADNAVMLVDGGKGLEPQTRKLFGVAKRSGLPVFTFVNKMDRPAMAPWDVLDEIEREFGLETVVRTWPIGDGERFRGVYETATEQLWLYERSARGQKALVRKLSVHDEEAVAAAIDDDELLEKFKEDLVLIVSARHPCYWSQKTPHRLTRLSPGTARRGHVAPRVAPLRRS